jgi:hypothetical protein
VSLLLCLGGVLRIDCSELSSLGAFAALLGGSAMNAEIRVVSALPEKPPIEAYSYQDGTTKTFIYILEEDGAPYEWNQKTQTFSFMSSWAGLLKTQQEIDNCGNGTFTILLEGEGASYGINNASQRNAISVYNGESWIELTNKEFVTNFAKHLPKNYTLGEIYKKQISQQESYDLVMPDYGSRSGSSGDKQWKEKYFSLWMPLGAMLFAMKIIFGALGGAVMDYEAFVVDELPETPKTSIIDPDGDSPKIVFYCYYIRSTGESYLSMDGETYLPSINIFGNMSSDSDSNMPLPEYGGIIYDIDEFALDKTKYYTLVTKEQNKTIYGITEDDVEIHVLNNGDWNDITTKIVGSLEEIQNVEDGLYKVKERIVGYDFEIPIILS